MYFGIQGLIERVPYALSGAFVGLYYSAVYLPSSSQTAMRYLAFIAAISTAIMVVIFSRVFFLRRRCNGIRRDHNFFPRTVSLSQEGKIPIAFSTVV